jgi:hypothetical protein
VLFGFRTKRVINLDEDVKTVFRPVNNEKDLYRISEISGILEVDEKVLLVIKQSKMNYVGFLFSSNVIYVTDKRMILRDISLHGLKENTIGIPYTIIADVSKREGLMSSSVRLRVKRTQGNNNLNRFIQSGITEADDIEWVIEHIPKSKASYLVRIVRSMIARREILSDSQPLTTETPDGILRSASTADSPADELLKIARLKSEGIINEHEFMRLKQNIIERTY